MEYMVCFGGTNGLFSTILRFKWPKGLGQLLIWNSKQYIFVYMHLLVSLYMMFMFLAVSFIIYTYLIHGILFASQHGPPIGFPKHHARTYPLGFGLRYLSVFESLKTCGNRTRKSHQAWFMLARLDPHPCPIVPP